MRERTISFEVAVWRASSRLGRGFCARTSRFSVDAEGFRTVSVSKRDVRITAYFAFPFLRVTSDSLQLRVRLDARFSSEVRHFIVTRYPLGIASLRSRDRPKRDLGVG